MSTNRPDYAHLWDMRAAALEILQFIEGLDFDAYIADHMRLLAVERNLEIIGEAARRVSSELKTSVSGIAWREINGLRNILAHDYSSINHRRIWNETLPKLHELIEQLDELIPPNPKEKA